MPDDQKSKSFPDISAKLSAIPKKSFFERQKAEAEAKRAREQAETAAVYEDFVKSFEDDNVAQDKAIPDARGMKFGGRPVGFAGGPPKRHFTSSGPRMSGPGTLGPPPPSLARKRTHEGLQPLSRNRDSTHGVLGLDNLGTVSPQAASAFRATDDDEDTTAVDTKEAERAAAKPTLYLASLPPGTSPSVIKSLIPPVLSVDNVKILRPQNQSSTDRKSVSAIVTLANESAASDIDSTVSGLQNRYLGWGFYLSISRHLSSAAISSSMPVTVGLASTSSLPFGAKNITPEVGARLNRAPPPGLHRGGFAPPSSYGPSYGRNTPATQVEVKTPSDIKQLRLIHKTLENLLNYGPEFEALLMSRPEVQGDEKWAWIWDARSPGGVYYRWKLWEVLTNASGRRSGRGKPRDPALVFEGGPSWTPPEANIKFEYTTRLDEFVSDEDYDSSDEDISDGEDDRKQQGGAAAEALATGNEGLGYMNPLQKAKLAHLLARLPTTHAKLRKGDVARVTAFAIGHAGAGADEVVEMIVSNILDPFVYTGANPAREVEKGLARREQTEASNDNPTAEGRAALKTLDTSSCKLIGLYLISDILSSSATSGVRHAWRYRQLFESALKAHRVFEHLGRLEKEFSWGRLKAEKWKRSVGSLLHMWEGWCVFPQSSQEHFFQVFDKPPLTEEEEQEEREKAEAERASAAAFKAKNRWKAVEEDSASKFEPSAESHRSRMDIDQPEMAPAGEEGWDGGPLSDIDGEPMEDSDLEPLDGEPMEYESPEEQPPPQPPQPPQPEKQPEQSEPPAQSDSRPPGRKPRPRAEDMFADSDSD